MKCKYYLCLIIMTVISCQSNTGIKKNVLWKLDNLQNIGGHKVEVLGEPQVIATSAGPAILFDGVNDAVLLDTIPVPKFSEFTIEVIFRPDSGGSREQRFFHIQERPDNRILMEIRLVDNNQWFLDTFIKAGEPEQTLFAEKFLHPTGQWVHAALVYDGKSMRHYVNGQKEMEGRIDYVPLSYGETSIGCRLNRVFWFKGAIREICISPAVLSPGNFKLQLE